MYIVVLWGSRGNYRTGLDEKDAGRWNAPEICKFTEYVCRNPMFQGLLFYPSASSRPKTNHCYYEMPMPSSHTWN
jgi:hypothetical protein